MAEAIHSSNQYPWEVTTQLREKIAVQYGLTKENILMGAGSSEILGIVAQYAALKPGTAIAADPTFGIWFTSAERSGLEIIKVPLTADKKHDLQRMKEKITEQTRLFYICNPNNPTGTVLPATELKDLISEVSKKTLVLLDEAYTEYSDETTLAAMVKDNPNLVIAKTFSKIYGMAGARIGYALAQADTIKQLNELQPWANAGASAVSLAGALASLDDHSFVKMSKTKNTEVRKLVTATFEQHHIHFIPSHTNFIYYSVKNQKNDLLAALASQNIRAGRLSDEKEKWTRISMGTTDDMKRFSQIVKESFKS
jgi:histidinol-phosphate aminotransferase